MNDVGKSPLNLYADETDEDFKMSMPESKDDNVVTTEDDLFNEAIEPIRIPTIVDGRKNFVPKSEPFSQKSSTNNAGHSSNNENSTSNIPIPFVPKKMIYIGNLSWWCNENDVVKSLEAIGIKDTVGIVFYEHKVNGMSKGYCRVTFNSTDSVAKAQENFKAISVQDQIPLILPFTKVNQMQLEAQTKFGRTNNRDSSNEYYEAEFRETRNQKNIFPYGYHTGNYRGGQQTIEPHYHHGPVGFNPQPFHRQNGMFRNQPPRYPPMEHRNPHFQNGYPPHLEMMIRHPPPPHHPAPHFNPHYFPHMVQSRNPAPVVEPAVTVERKDSKENISNAEVEELMNRNRMVSSSAISRAVSDAADGDFGSAIETLVTAIALIKASKVSNEPRIELILSTLKDTLYGIEDKHYSKSSDLFERFKDRSKSRDRHERSRRRSRSRNREYRSYREVRDRSREKREKQRRRSKSSEREVLSRRCRESEPISRFY